MSAQPQIHYTHSPYRGGVAEFITPDIARDLLEANRNNRPMNKRTVARYAEMMRRGAWRFNGDTIRIAKDGTVLDAQHRLQAIVDSGCGQWYIVVRGLPNDVFTTIDRGRKRQSADDLSILGEKYATSLAATLRWIYCLDSGRPVSYVKDVQPDLVLETLTKYPATRKWVVMFRTSTELTGLFDSYLPAVATLFAAKYGDELVEKFMAQLSTGENLVKTDPAWQLRARAIQNRSGAAKIRSYRFVPLVIKAFGAFVDGRKVVVLKYAANEEFPTI